MSKKIAFIFPGQGSQSVGMLADMGEKYTLVRDTFSQASDALDYDLWELVQNGPQESLNQTDKTQPALLVAAVAIYRLWKDKGGSEPILMAGHSLGEYTALTCAGVLAFADACQLVEKRGQFMQAAVPAGVGKMAAIIGLDDAAIEQACQSASEGEVVAAVNYNSPGQVVIGGATAAVERAMEACKEAGAKRALPVAMSVPSHCQLMKPAADNLAEYLKGLNLKTPEIAVVNNVDVVIESEPGNIADALVRQLYCPVRWVQVVESFTGKGVETIVECGPGKVLTGLNKRIQKNLQCVPTSSVDAFEQLINS